MNENNGEKKLGYALKNVDPLEPGIWWGAPIPGVNVEQIHSDKVKCNKEAEDKERRGDFACFVQHHIACSSVPRDRCPFAAG